MKSKITNTTENNKLIKLMNTAQSAKYLGVSKRTLENWRNTERYALPFVKIGDLVRYRLEDLNAFISSNVVIPNALPSIK